MADMQKKNGTADERPEVEKPNEKSASTLQGLLLQRMEYLKMIKECSKQFDEEMSKYAIKRDFGADIRYNRQLAILKRKREQCKKAFEDCTNAIRQLNNGELPQACVEQDQERQKEEEEEKKAKLPQIAKKFVSDWTPERILQLYTSEIEKHWATKNTKKRR